MKVWEKVTELNNGQMIIHLSNCPSTIEEKYHALGERRFKRHCGIGCGVKCLDEYLDLEIKEA